jgi:hypothetical protein
MRRATVLWEVFVTRFEEAFEQYRRRSLSGEEAGELLGMSGRKFRRLCVRYEEEGVEGLRDRRIGRASGASMRRRDFIARAVISWMRTRAAASARPRRIDVCFSRQELECLTFLRSTDPVLQ